MKIIEPSYEIWDCPDGEACLAKLERIGRVAYKSEDKIDHGSSDLCPHCAGQGKGHGPGDDCRYCGPNATVCVREPSSHKFIRMILRSDRREQLAKRGAELVQSASWSAAHGEEQARMLVDMVLDNVRDDPPHDGILEHASITVYFEGNRGFTHELVRHRIASYLQESTRYCNYSKGRFGNSITLIKRSFDTEEQIDEWMLSVGADEASYMKLIDMGVKPELARDVLPQALKAGIVITANLSSWRNIFRKRCSPRAHPDMRALMPKLLEDLRERIPLVFEEL